MEFSANVTKNHDNQDWDNIVLDNCEHIIAPFGYQKWMIDHSTLVKRFCNINQDDHDNRPLLSMR